MDLNYLLKTNLRQIEEAFINKNILPGNVNYTRFLILTRARTGSNLLISYLNNHPNIRAYGEVFGNIGNKNIQDLIDIVYSKKSHITKSVGFKIFYYHPNDSKSQDIWDYLLSDIRIKVIHLKRKNLLRSLVSELIAYKTNIWKEIHVGNSIKSDQKKIYVDVNSLINQINQNLEWIESFEKKFKEHDSMNINYEDLVKNPDSTLNSIFSFLQVKKIKVQSFLQKQNPEKLEDLIINYSELSKHLKKNKLDKYLSMS